MWRGTNLINLQWLSNSNLQCCLIPICSVLSNCFSCCCLALSRGPLNPKPSIIWLKPNLNCLGSNLTTSNLTTKCKLNLTTNCKLESVMGIFGAQKWCSWLKFANGTGRVLADCGGWSTWCICSGCQIPICSVLSNSNLQLVVKFQFAVGCRIPIYSWLSNSYLQLVVKFQFAVGCQIPIYSWLSNSYLQFVVKFLFAGTHLFIKQMGLEKYQRAQVPQD